MVKLVRADSIEEGHCFRKRTGAYAYLRLSEGSVRFLKLDTNFVYGICYNGNVVKLPKDKMVAPVPVTRMDENRDFELAWNRTFAKEGWEWDKEDDKEPAVPPVLILKVFQTVYAALVMNAANNIDIAGLCGMQEQDVDAVLDKSLRQILQECSAAAPVKQEYIVSAEPIKRMANRPTKANCPSYNTDYLVASQRYYDEGYKARTDNRPESDYPYNDEGSFAWSWWKAGYDDAANERATQ